MRELIASHVTHAVIPTVTALTSRHFKNKQGPDGDELAPKHPAVKFVIDAWSDGDFTHAHEHMTADCEVYTNGLSIRSEHRGPAMAKESIEAWRAIAPDITMELTQEIREEHPTAIEFRIKGTHTGDAPGLPASGEAIDVEGTAFLTLDGDKIARSGRCSTRWPSPSRAEPRTLRTGGRDGARSAHVADPLEPCVRQRQPFFELVGPGVIDPRYGLRE